MTAGTLQPMPRSRSRMHAPAGTGAFDGEGSAPQACIRSIELACRAHAAFTTELVVVDNGSSDDTAERVARAAATSSIAITLVSQPRRGLAAARNAGLERARGRVLVFVDDDCDVDPGYLRDLERHYAGGGPCTIRGGRVDLADPEDLPFTIKRSPVRERLSRDVHPGGFVVGCNMTMNREVAALVGPFDERFGAGGPLLSAEDTDYLVRAFLLGIPVEYVPDMTIFHRHGRKTRRAIKKLHRSYCLGNGGLYLKHVRDAPWLLRHFYWTLRSGFRELGGGPMFDRELRLSHWIVVFMNLLGAAKFALLARRPRRMEVRQVQQEMLG
jgi:GT2 family glycosyltransferase